MTAVSAYRHVFRLPAEREALFELFSDPRLLDTLTPPWFRLRPLGELPRRLRAGSEISYRLRWRGVPLRWTSRITDWRPPGFFAYEQLRGPFRYFRHEHSFEASGGGTEVVDRVVFRAPGGSLADRLIAGPDLRRIFAFRERQARRFPMGLGTDSLPDPATRVSQAANYPL